MDDEVRADGAYPIARGVPQHRQQTGRLAREDPPQPKTSALSRQILMLSLGEAITAQHKLHYGGE